MFFRRALHTLLFFSLNATFAFPAYASDFGYESRSTHDRKADTDALLSPTDWDSFSRNMDQLKTIHESHGLSYMITGAIVAIGGGILTAQSNDSLTKLTLSLIQSVGIAGVGYGAGIYFEQGPDEIFRDTIALQRDLTGKQKDELTQNYLLLNKESNRRRKLITSLTYGLVAAFNAYNATQTNDSGLRTVYWAVAGANAAFSLSFAF